MQKGGIETAIAWWGQLMEGLHESPQHFYEAVTAAIEKRDIPNCRLSRVFWREGGLFSAKREYLRAKRRDHLVDICGAPFGDAFFSSSWLCLPPPSLLRAILLTIIGVVVAGDCVLELLRFNPLVVLNQPPGVVPQFIVTHVLTYLAVLVIDLFITALIVLLGIIRPLFFPPRPTYYRVDTAHMFYWAVHHAVRDVIQGLRAEQGLRLLTDDELKPIMRGFGRY